MNKKIILILLILLSGCSEDSANKEEPVKNRVMVVDDSLKEVPRKKEKEPEPEKPVEIEVDMDEELESSEHERQSRQNNLSIRALELRAERKASYVSSFQKHTKMEPTKYILEDKNYDPFPKDVSTLPVDRSRTLTTDMRINAVLDDDINSQIPGEIGRAHV